jgi:hypothetical protein
VCSKNDKNNESTNAFCKIEMVIFFPKFLSWLFISFQYCCGDAGHYTARKQANKNTAKFVSTGNACGEMIITWSLWVG